MHGFDIVAAESVDAAQERLRDHQVQGAVIDLRLPQGSGREVVLSIPPPTPVIIFSAAPDESGRLETMRPNTRLILKPFSLVMLVETLHGMIEAAARNEPDTRRIRASQLPNSQLPTPKGSYSNNWGEKRANKRLGLSFTLLLRAASLGSWELEVGSCL